MNLRKEVKLNVKYPVCESQLLMKKRGNIKNV
jgi:hypothetical protein